MKKAIFLLMLLLLVGCSATNTTKQEETMENKATYHELTPEQAKEMMQQEGVLILDVRTQPEYDEGHIEGAVLLPDFEVAKRAESVLSDKGQTILVYCRSGVRSLGAANTLVSLGYTNVYDFGGIMYWPYATVK